MNRRTLEGAWCVRGLSAASTVGPELVTIFGARGGGGEQGTERTFLGSDFQADS